MTVAADQVLEQVLKLPDQERGRIALRLLESLDETDDITEAELLDELQSRLKEGFEGSMSWDELRRTR